MAVRNVNFLVLILAACIFGTGCQPLMVNTLSDRLTPSNDRDWSPELSVLPTAEFRGDTVQIRNIRNCQYLSDEDFVVDHFDRTLHLDDIQSVDFIVVPFKQSPALAHTMLSFGLSDGTYLGVSVEVRHEKEESYKPLLGVTNQFEIMYVVADERDLIRLRTHHRDADVYVYPTVATAVQAQDLFKKVMVRINKLAGQPEFYHSLKNNCTTNLVSHVNDLKNERIPFSWKVLLPGFSARYAYDLGLLDNRIPFEDLEMVAHVNELADRHFHDDDFSQKIRSNRSRIDRAIRQASIRESQRGASSGLQYLQQRR